MRPNWLRFPDTVNEKAARVVAAGVVVQSVLFLVTGWSFLFVTLVLGFLARVLAGPTLSPLGRLAVHVVAPRLGEPKIVSGAPKRFAQGIGLFVSSVGLIGIVAGVPGVAVGAAAMLVFAAGLESALAICLGCIIYGELVRRGVFSDAACAECADISLRRRSSHTATAA